MNTMKEELIFCYGSNMSFRRLKERVSSAKFHCIGYVNNYLLTFEKESKDGSGKATLIDSNNSNDIVWGVVYTIEAQQKPILNKFEALGYGYDDFVLRVTNSSNSQMSAIAYIGNKKYLKPNLKPYGWYLRHLIVGATESKLPKAYIKKLLQIDYIKDNNQDRITKNNLYE